MLSKFKILISSDQDYEELCAEIYFENQFVAILTQEEGLDNLEIKIHTPKNKKYWDFKWDDFEKVVQNAKMRLWN